MEMIRIFKILQIIQYVVSFILLIISWKKALSLKMEVANEKQYNTAFNLYMIGIGLAFLADWKYTALKKVPYFQQKDFIVILVMTLITFILSSISLIRAKRLNKSEIAAAILDKYLKSIFIFIVIMFVMIISFVLALNS